MKSVTLRLFLFCLFILIPFAFVSAQRGKNGARTVAAANTIVNEYTSLTSPAAIGDKILMVTASSLNTNGRFTSGNLQKGDLIMIIQMQGATIKPNAGGDVVGDTTFGEVQNYNNCGLYEFVQVADVPGAGLIALDCGLKYAYSSAGKVQVIRVPRYDSLVINNGGVLTCDIWNGTTGGVLAVEVENNTIINTGGSINVTGKGFRGGALDYNDAVFGSIRWTTAVNTEGAEKGEGIGGYQTEYDGFGGRFCRGAPGNGGGGGNAHNTGGGGGANAGDINLWNGKGNPDNTQGTWTTAWNLEGGSFSANTSSGGGRGGYSFSSSNQNAITLGPTNGAWGGDGRSNRGGWGGRPLDYNTGRIFLGGGGGCGDQNVQGANLGYAGAGGIGGGIVYLMNYGTVSGAGQVIANGGAGGDSRVVSGVMGRDAGGGGGGGGVAIINSVGTITGISVTATGGKGGNVTLVNGANEAYGPGGGGGGGYAAISNGAITLTAAGGANGTTNSQGLQEFPPNGATSGGAGINNGSVTNFTITAANDTICPGASTTLTALLNGTVPGGTTIVWSDSVAGGATLATGSTLNTPVLNNTTTYYVGTCPGTYRIPVTVVVFTSFSVDAGPDTSVCPGGSDSLKATGGVSYVWSPGATLSCTACQNTLATPVGTTKYIVTVTNSIGCTATDSVTVTVRTVPAANAGNDTSVCIGSPANLMGTGGTTYLWSPAPTLSCDTCQNTVANTTLTRKYYLLVTDAFGCSGNDSVTVTVDSLPKANAGNDTSFCSGDSVQLVATGGSSYLWSPGATLSCTGCVNPYASPIAPTQYIVTVTDGNGCSNNDTVEVNVHALPPADAGNDVTICTGSSSNLNASGGSTYLWSPSTNLSCTACQNPLANPVVQTVYTVLVTDTNGCEKSDSMTVFIGTALTVSAGNDTTICPGSGAFLNVTGGLGTTFSWTPTASLSNPSIANPIATPSVQTTYYVTVTDAGGCSGTDSVVVFIGGVLPVNAGNDTTICPGTSAFLDVIVSKGQTYAWTPTPTLSNPAIRNPVATPSSTTKYFVTVTDSSGCQGTDSVTVTIGSGLTVNAGNDTTICPGTSANLGATLTSGQTYAWTPASSLNNAAIQTPAATPSATTTYYVTVTAANGCTGIDSVRVMIGSGLSVNAGNDTTICPGTNASLNVTGAIGQIYSWSPSTGLTNPAIKNPLASPGGTTQYIVTVTDSTGCQGKDTVLVTIGPGLTVKGYSDTTICLGKNVQLSADSGASYLWTPSSTLSCSTCRNPVATPGSTSNYTVTVTAANGCTGSDVVTVTVSTLSVNATPDSTTIARGGSVQINTSAGTTYLWTPSSTLSCSACPDPKATPVVTTTYYVTVTDANGCQGIDSVLIVIRENTDLFVPTGFSPNGDNENDFFRVRGTGIASLEIIIYDRWGEKVFETNDVKQSWDGTYKGQPMNPGVFVYFLKVKFTDQSETVKEGNITLIR